MGFNFYCTCCCLDCIEGKHCWGKENDHGICMWPVEDDTEDDTEEDIYDDYEYLPLFERGEE